MRMDDLDRALESNAFVRYLGILSVGLGVLFASLTVYPPIAAARVVSALSLSIAPASVRPSFACSMGSFCSLPVEISGIS